VTKEAAIKRRNTFGRPICLGTPFLIVYLFIWQALVKIKADFITERILKGENEFMPDARDVAQDKKAMEQNEEQGTTAEVVGKHPEHAPQAGKKTPQVDHD